MTSPLGNHSGPQVSAANFVFEKSSKPHVHWVDAVGLGHRYDVKTFTVRLAYTVLE